MAYKNDHIKQVNALVDTITLVKKNIKVYPDAVHSDVLGLLIQALDFEIKYYNSAIRIQKKWRQCYEKKTRSAIKIQKKWRNVIADPECKPCKNRLMWEYREMM